MTTRGVSDIHEMIHISFYNIPMLGDFDLVLTESFLRERCSLPEGLE